MDNVVLTLSAWRENAGLTIEEVSKKVGKHKNTIMKYERDSSRIPHDLLRKLSILYQAPMDNIFLGKKYELIRKIRNRADEQLV
ncbi:helix-turn-helix domain-containing protein [Listeria valentina]|uniref:helix-turn-helix domain-containing protein n=1 Tax=Listeria valentina TaxID=2705293 RepID=UPI0014318B40|nr:helix-turn-helix transcriptional regulator [Listeria valentina]